MLHLGFTRKVDISHMVIDNYKIYNLMFRTFLLIEFGCILLLASCSLTKNSKSNRSVNLDQKMNFYIDSFSVQAPSYSLAESVLTEKLDSLVIIAGLEQDETFWESKFPSYITIEPYLNNDTVYFKLKIGKDYLLNFDPPDIDFSKKFFQGFGVAKYKNLLVRLNGNESMYILKNDNENDNMKLLINGNTKLDFMVYGVRDGKDDSWFEPFHPFVRTYYVFTNNSFVHYLTEVER